MTKFTFVWWLLYLCLEADAGRSAHFPGELSENDPSRCDFDISRKIYNATDLLQCMNELATDLSDRGNGRSTPRQSSQSDSTLGESPHDFPHANLISSLLDNVAASILHTHGDTPSNPAASLPAGYQSDRPGEPSGQFAGLGPHLFDALSSISRHDDLRCVSRILCEAASGKLPGKYQRPYSAFSGNFDRSPLSQLAGWIADAGSGSVAGTSPLLNFARAAVLGYGGGGDPATCYRAYPRCPRNPDKLVHYLNNHNGGFFRFFGGRGRPQAHSPYVSQQGNTKFLGGGRRKALPPGYAGAEADRTGTGKLKFDIGALVSARQEDDRRKSFFPKEDVPESSGRVVFPVHEEPSDRPSGDRIPKSLPESESSDANELSRDYPSFFPQEDRDVRALRLTAQPPNSIPHVDAFRFPR